MLGWIENISKKGINEIIKAKAGGNYITFIYVNLHKNISII